MERGNTPGYEPPRPGVSRGEADWWVTYTPNSARLPRPNVHHTTAVRMRADGGFGYSDPTRFPQFIHSGYQHLIFMRVPPEHRGTGGLETDDWWPDDVEHQLYMSAVDLLNRATPSQGPLGQRMYRVGPNELERFRSAWHAIHQRLMRAEQKLGHSHRIRTLRSMIYRGYQNLALYDYTHHDFVFQIGVLQRTILEARALLEFWVHLEIWAPSIEERGPPLDDNRMGGFVTDLRMIGFCVRYGIPVFGIMPSSRIPSNMEWGRQGLDATPYPCLDDPRYGAYPVRFLGPSWSLRHIQEVSSFALGAEVGMSGKSTSCHSMCIA